MYIYIYIHIYIYIFIYVYLYIFIYLFIHIYLFFLYIYTYEYIYIRIFSLIHFYQLIYLLTFIFIYSQSAGKSAKTKERLKRIPKWNPKLRNEPEAPTLFLHVEKVRQRRSTNENKTLFRKGRCKDADRHFKTPPGSFLFPDLR